MTFSRLWLKSWPKVKLCKLPGKVTFSRLWLKKTAKSQALQTAGQSDVLQALVEKTWPKVKSLQTVGQSDVLQALVEIIAKSQVFANCRAK